MDSTQIRAALNVEVERHTQTVEALRQLAAQDETLETLRRRNAELAGALERLRAAADALWAEADDAGYENLDRRDALRSASNRIKAVLASASRPTEAPDGKK